jgi:hypothetical protein
MISLHSMMAVGNTMQKLPQILLIVAGCLMGIAFVIGFLKGFRKVGWNGLIWATAGSVFIVASRSINSTGTVTKKFVLAMLIALACIAGVLALYGLLSYYLRPKIKWVKDNVNGDTSLAAYGLEFEPEYVNYDGEDDWQPYGKRIKKTGFTPPCFAFRLLGGLACAINVGVILWAIGSVVLLGISATSLADKNVGLILTAKYMDKFLALAQKTVLDVLCIGLIITIAKKGYSAGLMNSVRAILVSLGTLALIGLCFYLPFSPFATRDAGIWHFLVSLTNRCINMMHQWVPKFSKPLGKIVAGAVMSIGAGILMFLINLALKKWCKFVSTTASTRMVDSILACVLYMIIGALVCVAIWFALSALDYFGILHISEALTDKGAHLSNGLYKFTNRFLVRWLR